ncbi:L-glyceraldehyde 3-phosphate reductase [Alkalitalea saponilacus]|uniref:L-glyceraldehyde 3-phosphate reductase n=1 Tax=Alkalitalea saponilacus TaxID=889453 RepID=A0A1T5HH36_9BACT|nr:L-glyceraldehyde 3-phosphate reductase [Alkalitalea saponilacus]ASB48129.1 L-glyceraldehyde 3-phosphate reductase [Alkalitalea saponilacus]SKC19939.1 L-glyceraldehyde 3-phosphate reductase [Alkalitalea saponilacus]
MIYKASESRYEKMQYRRSGKSGILLPVISLGLWHNFGSVDRMENMREMLTFAFDQGITHFDLANNYGPVPGSAEENFGRFLAYEFKHYRDEMIISTKAGYGMWPGPYGEWGSKKYLVASLDQSLKRMGLDYVDIFYSHRPDPDTPLEETMAALDLIVRQGKALYVGISNYTAEQTQRAESILHEMGTPCLIHQPRYSILDRWAEDGLLNVLDKRGVGCIAFSPLAQGLLTSRYLDEIPADSRIAKPHGFLQKEALTEDRQSALRKLNEIAQMRGQTLSQMAIAWLLRDTRITSVLLGASSVNQLKENLEALRNYSFSAEELELIDKTSKPVMMR